MSFTDLSLSLSEDHQILTQNEEPSIKLSIYVVVMYNNMKILIPIFYRFIENFGRYISDIDIWLLDISIVFFFFYIASLFSNFDTTFSFSQVYQTYLFLLIENNVFLGA